MASVKEQTIETLKQGRRNIKNGWIQDSYVSNGGCCTAGAVRLGSNHSVNLSESVQIKRAFRALVAALPKKYRTSPDHSTEGHLTHWNDNPNRTKGQVLALFTRAIRLVKEGK